MSDQKSLLATINTGFKKEKVKNKPGCKHRDYIDNSDSNLNTGFEHTEKPIVPEIIPDLATGPEQFPESIKQTVQTGFGPKDTLHKECPTPNLVTYLLKEKYLAEFEKETEKQLARNNLGVYSAQEVDQTIKTLTINFGKDFVLKESFEERLQQTINNFNKIVEGLEYVDSITKAQANYVIPETLFNL